MALHDLAVDAATHRRFHIADRGLDHHVRIDFSKSGQAVLRQIRLRQGRTLRDVATAAGVSVPYLSEVERGRKEASSEVLASICRALGVHLADLPVARAGRWHDHAELVVLRDVHPVLYLLRLGGHPV